MLTKAHWIDEWLDGLTADVAGRRPSEALRRERFMVGGLIAAFLGLVTFPVLLVLQARGIVLLLWSGLVLVPLLAVYGLSLSRRTHVPQIAISTALTLLVLFGGWTAGWSPAFLCLALSLVPLQAAAAGSRRCFLVSLVLMAGGMVSAGQLGETPLHLPVGVVAAVVVMLVLSHAVARIVVEKRLDDLLSEGQTPPNADGESLRALDDLVTWHDRNGAILRCNGASSALLGVPSSAISGSGLFTRILVGDRPAFLKAVSDAARGGSTAVVQFRVKSGNASPGDFVWVEMRVHGVRLQGDLSCSAVAVTRDISAHRRDAEERDALRRAAVDASEVRAQLLATVSHELRTLLNAIIGYSDILTGKGNLVQLERRESYAGIIHQSGEHMLGVVNTLLDLSSIEAGRYELAMEAVAMAHLVRECMAIVALQAEQNGVRLQSDISDDLPGIIADRRACRQMILNLLTNAVKFTPRGGEVRIDARRERDGVTVSVSDTGIGIDDHDLTRLGVPFCRSSARQVDAKGSGLGLSVVRGLVALHRGRMAIAGTPGRGTVIRITLPIDGVKVCERGESPDPAPDALFLPAPTDMIVLKTG